MQKESLENLLNGIRSGKVSLKKGMKILKELGYDEYGLKVGGKQKGLDSFF